MVWNQIYSPDVRIKIGNKILKRAKCVKFLGILLDEYLNWKHHITELSKKLSRACGILFKIRNFLPTNLLIDVYNSLFMSYLQYGKVVWGLTFASYIDCIAKVKKKLSGLYLINPIFLILSPYSKN